MLPVWYRAAPSRRFPRARERRSGLPASLPETCKEVLTTSSWVNSWIRNPKRSFDCRSPVGAVQAADSARGTRGDKRYGALAERTIPKAEKSQKSCVTRHIALISIRYNRGFRIGI